LFTIETPVDATPVPVNAGAIKMSKV